MSDVNQEHIDNAIEELFVELTRAGISMKKMAAMSGVTRATLSNWRNGHSVPSLGKYLQVRATIHEALQ